VGGLDGREGVGEWGKDNKNIWLILRKLGYSNLFIGYFIGGFVLQFLVYCISLSYSCIVPS
jgi:hypothetical protein